MSASEFLDRVFDHIRDLSHPRVFGEAADVLGVPPKDLSRAGGFEFRNWSYAKRPTSEAVGLLPVEIDVDLMVGCILAVEEYPRNVRYVTSVEVIDKRSDSDFTYVQRMDLPLLGGLQSALAISDDGEREGYRVVSWQQDDAATDALDRKAGGARTDYNLGAWLLKPDQVLYALVSAPRKQDVGSLKYAVMTKGAEATAREVLRSNIEGMVAWSKRT